MVSDLVPPVEVDASAIEAWKEDLSNLFRHVFRPKPVLSMSEWADEHRYLSKETSAEPGRWRTERTPYLKDVMDTVSDPEVREIVIMKASRVGYTEGVLGNSVGYFMHQSPVPILIVQPTEGDARDWSQKQLDPMIRDTPVLAGVIPERRAREPGNTTLDKMFPGGSLTIRGGHSPKALRRVTAAKVFLDELDGFVVSAGQEGDPLLLAKRACRTFPDRTFVVGSTPTLQGLSRIEKEFAKTDQRHLHVPCPHCDELQVLEWGGPDKTFGIKWDKETWCTGCGNLIEGEHCADCSSAEVEVTHLPETAWYQCRHCNERIEEIDKPDMVRAGTWIAANPRSQIAGYHIPTYYSLFEGASWSEMVREFLGAKDDQEQLQVWWNQWLGLPFEPPAEKVTATGLASRAEIYLGDDGESCEIPHGVGVLTAGVDVQKDRLELLIRGWGYREESWMSGHFRIYGDTLLEETWSELEAYLTRPWLHASGRTMRIKACMIDSGFRPDPVYQFVKNKQASRKVYAAKGIGGEARVPLSRATRANVDKVKIFRIGTHPMKDTLFGRLRRARPGPGYYHFCGPTDSGADAEFFKQFEAEKKVRDKNGSKYVKTRERNESIDLEILALAALHSLGMPLRKRLGRLAEKYSEPFERSTREDASEPKPKSKKKRRLGKKNWVTRGLS